MWFDYCSCIFLLHDCIGDGVDVLLSDKCGMCMCRWRWTKRWTKRWSWWQMSLIVSELYNDSCHVIGAA